MTAGPKVVYLTGWGRSGSTVLNRLLTGEGVVGVGELRLLWQRGLLERQHCSCGRTWDGCQLWGPVVRSVLGTAGATGVNAAVATGVNATADTTLDTSAGTAADLDARAAGRRLHELGERAGRSISRSPDHLRGAAAEYAQLLGEVYRSIAQQTGAQLIVDSSKSPVHAMLARASGVPATVVHLVRDPRGVVWSHQRAKAPPPGAAARVTERHGPVYVATRWTIRNAYIDRRVAPELRIRYEDMVADTDRVITEIFSAAGLPVPAQDAGIEHLIAGNPNRFEPARPRQLREDAEWRHAQPGRQQRLTRLIAGRVMRRYGYQ